MKINIKKKKPKFTKKPKADSHERPIGDDIQLDVDALSVMHAGIAEAKTEVYKREEEMLEHLAKMHELYGKGPFILKDGTWHVIVARAGAHFLRQVKAKD